MNENAITLSVSGASGRMGRAVLSIAHGDDALRVVEALASQASDYLGVDAWALAGQSAAEADPLPITELQSEPAAVMIDFSLPAGFDERVRGCIEHGTAFVSGTTGLSDAQEALLEEASQKIPVLLAANFSLGIAVMAKLASQAAQALENYDIEVTEMHHRRKQDAPSGTAKRLLEAVLDPLGRSYADDVKHGREGITGERSQREIGMHTLRGGDVVGDHSIIFAGEGERVEITHRATSRETFARGAVHAAKWLAGKPAGRYTIEDVLGLG